MSDETVYNGLAAALAPYTGDPISRGRAVAAVTTALREAILDGALRPDDWLREDDIASILSVSRTPVRTAISQLVEEGLARKTTNQGATVARLSMEDIIALYVVRENLEGLAARLATARHDVRLIEELERIGDEMEQAAAAGAITELANLNLRWHRRLREASGNVYLDRFLAQVEYAVRRMPTSTFARPGRTKEILAEHDAVLSAIRARDAAAAENHAQIHMRNARSARLADLLDARSPSEEHLGTWDHGKDVGRRSVGY
ncbi:MAG: FCD domain-containing protein [Propionibacteriales bacterium]|nr:FCD domain-containing protein [Propionibacteriales bacterium]